MKKFLVGFALPAAAAIAVVGSGFAVWVFGTDAKTQSEDKASINVTQLVKVGSFTQASTSKVILDQTVDGRTAAGVTAGAVGADLEAKGIYMSDFKNGTTTADNSIKYTESKKDDDNTIDHVDGKVKTVKKTYIFIPKVVAKYVKVTSGALTVADFNADYTYKADQSATSGDDFAATDYTSYCVTWTDKTADCTDTIYLPTDTADTSKPFAFKFEYTTADTATGILGEPKTATEYVNMYKAVKDSKIYIISEAVLTKIGA